MDNGTISTTNTKSNITDDIPEDLLAECELFPDNPSYCETLVICKRVTCVLSIVGSLFTLAIIVLFKKYRAFPQRLIAHLSLASMLVAISFMMSDFSSTSEGVCRFQGAWVTYQLWVTMLVSMTILASIYFSVTKGNDLHKYEKYLAAIYWVLPFLLAGIPFSDDVYGPAGVWCWMKNEWEWQFGIWYIWKVISDVVFFVVIIRVWYILRRRPETTPNRSSNDDDIKTLMIYPVVYFLIFLLPTITRIYNAVNHVHGQRGYNFTLSLFLSISAPSFGATVTLTFVLDAKTRLLLRQKHIFAEIRKKWCPSERPRSYQTSEGVENNVV